MPWFGRRRRRPAQSRRRDPSHEPRTDSVDDAGRGRPGPLPLGSRRDPRRGHMLVCAHPDAVVGRHPRAGRLYRYRPADGGAVQKVGLRRRISAVTERALRPGPDRDVFCAATPSSILTRQATAPRYRTGRRGRAGGQSLQRRQVRPGRPIWGGPCTIACEATHRRARATRPRKLCEARHGLRRRQRPTWSRTAAPCSTTTRRGRSTRSTTNRGRAPSRIRASGCASRAGGGLPDGMTTDAAGRLWIAHWGGACVTCHDPRKRRRTRARGAAHEPHHELRFRRAGAADAVCDEARGPDWSPEQRRAEPLAGGLFAFEVADPGIAPALFAG